MVLFLCLIVAVYQVVFAREMDDVFRGVGTQEAKKLNPLCFKAPLPSTPPPGESPGLSSVASSTKTNPAQTPPISTRLALGPSVHQLACDKLCEAIKNHDSNGVLGAFRMADLDINTSINDMDDTALMLSICSGFEQLMLWLLQKGANPLLPNKCGCSAWSMVVTLCYLHPSKEAGGRNVVSNISYGSLSENTKRVCVLAGYLPVRAGGVAAVDAPLFGVNATIWEIESRSAESIKYRTLEESLPTALAYAADNANPFLVRALKERGANLNVKTPRGFTPLSLACIKGHNSMARLLVELGANIDVWRDISCPSDRLSQAFRVAVTIGCERLARLIFAKGQIDIEYPMELGRTLLMRTVFGKDVDMILLLIDLGANAIAADEMGHTASFYAEQNGLREIALLLKGLEIQKKVDLLRKVGEEQPALKRNPLTKFGAPA